MPLFVAVLGRIMARRKKLPKDGRSLIEVSGDDREVDLSDLQPDTDDELSEQSPVWKFW